MKKTMMQLAVTGLVLALATAVFAAQGNDQAGDLLRPVRAGAKVPLPAHAVGRQARVVEVNRQALEHARINLDFFDGRRMVAVRDRTEEPGAGDSVWVGRIEGEPLSRVSIASRNGTVAGVIDRPTSQGNELLEIHPVAPGISVLFPVDEALLPPCAPPVADSGQGQRAQAQRQPVPEAASSLVTIDLMVVYTPASAARNGGTAGMEAKILQAVADANTGYQNSQIGIQMRLVYMGLVDYTETGRMADAVDRLVDPTDECMDEVHALRTTCGADLVALIDEDSDACGNAHMINPGKDGAASRAFCVVWSACLSSLTLTHELGHLQGCHHNREDALDVYGNLQQGAYPWSYGWRLCNSRKNGFRTVMSYSCTWATRINYFSNPDLSYNGYPLGVDHLAANAADNALSMNMTAPTVAGFRVTTVPPAPPAPAAPTSLIATPVSTVQINLTWVTGSGSCSGFLVERSLNQSTWSQIGGVPGTSTAYADNSLLPNTLYYYRVRAYNEDTVSGLRSYSAYSNIASARTKRR